MSGVELNPGVHACIDKSAAVLLDLRRDRYFSIALPNGGIGGQGALCDGLAAIAERLLEAGLAAPASAPLSSAEIASIQTQTRLLKHRHAWQFVSACLWARSAVVRRRIDLALAQLARAAAARVAACVEEAEVWRTQERFERLRPFFPGARVCLLDTLALARFALGEGVRLTIVFGVRVRSFSAHCWAEWRGVAVNDRYGHAHAYQPILRAPL